eukprot:scaffold1504_cov417-Prasinococcus_capsulatus_cf.AAC.35
MALMRPSKRAFLMRSLVTGRAQHTPANSAEEVCLRVLQKTGDGQAHAEHGKPRTAMKRASGSVKARTWQTSHFCSFSVTDSIATRLWELASLLAQWMRESQLAHRLASSAKQKTTAFAFSHASHRIFIWNARPSSLRSVLLQTYPSSRRWRTEEEQLAGGLVRYPRSQLPISDHSLG